MPSAAWNRSAIGLVLMSLAAALSCSATTTTRTKRTTTAANKKPNFLFILTDDQDIHLDSLEYMPLLKKHMTDQGTMFDKHYCTVSLCCPSRVSMLTGRAAHNTNVTFVEPPYGGYTKSVSEGWNDNYLPIWLQEAGYDTYYVGKLMNGLATDTYNSPFPRGWNKTNFFLDPYTYLYYNVSMGQDEEEPKMYTGQYSTDLALERGLSYLDTAIPRAASGEAPFFITVAPIAPHAEMGLDGYLKAPVPAERHKDLFPGLQVPRTTNFNPDEPSAASWIKNLDKLTDKAVDYLDYFHMQRVRSLQAADELVAALVQRLEHGAGSSSRDVLDNTYVIYTTDNGFHLGQHRLGAGKTCAIEEDIHIPFIIRGPGVAQGKTMGTSFPTSHTDFVPTVFELAGLPLQDEFDGSPMPVTEEQQEQLAADTCKRKAEHVNVEYWGYAIAEGAFTLNFGPGTDNYGNGGNATYKSLRIVADEYDLSYTVWCTDEHELYDMKTDPVQMRNLYSSQAPIYGWDPAKLTSRVDALLLTLKNCKGVTCREPWHTLHPAGDVHSLIDAMNPKFDDFYREQPKVSFDGWYQGYLLEHEGPAGPVPFPGGAGGFAQMRRWWENWT